ncbi:SDR family oxidoreductase [Salipaludibacillus aurantiacus]|uniref:3-oxoacyl-[acyl-carrier protein] reductase n=1 Tax=Salipaludibacillus aurantiacus TaxID=1601833 RepID=A0A1H9X5U7_9BACI|nr:SDR family oxidoreductase [Salipaludibacillus aurantiacus]SES41421.1 3-oxoacyl-[acyl-carrier protein] reductase [Salipaludibacillus aurantiacus]
MAFLTGKTALVTGVSRSQGIGAAICREFARKGADILFTYWTDYDQSMPWGVESSEPASLKRELESYNVRCENIELDLTAPAAPVTLLDFAAKAFGSSPDILVNNACYSVNDSISTITAGKLDSHYKVNVRAVTLLTQAFVDYFTKKEGKNGRIINLTTGWNRGQMPDELSYVLTKSAVETLTYTLASTLAEKHITINAINPGPTNSGWMNEEIKKDLLPRFPSGRLGEPEDAAKLASFLAGDEAAWVTGQVIHSEGGFRNGDA